MGVDPGNLLIQITSTDARECLEGIRLVLKDKSEQKSNLPPEIIKALEQIAFSSNDAITRNLAKKALGKDECLDLYNPLAFESTAEKINTENIDTKEKRQRIWGWIFTMIGGAISLPSILIFILSIECFVNNCVAGMDMMGIIGMGMASAIGLVIGTPLLTLGIWLLFRKKEEKWDYVFSIVGGVWALWGLFWILAGVGAMISEAPRLLFYLRFLWGVPGLVVGIPLCIHSIKVIRHKNK